MVTAIVAVAAFIFAFLVVELLARRGKRNSLLFAVLDHLISDESPLEVPPMHAGKTFTHRAA